jgi:ferric-dicitrate binding protein FerR (iron transport regulator)
MNEDLLLKVLLRKASPQEEELVTHWLAQQSSHRALFDELKKALAHSEQSSYNTLAGLDRLRERILTEHLPLTHTSETDLPKPNLRYWGALVVRIAAAILIFAGLGWVSYQYIYTPADTIAVPLREISTLTGQRKMVVLPDGSQVWLSAASILRYPASFAGPTRDVYMEGEIFFKVKRNEQKPFRIRTGTLAIEVLGTSFTVHSYLERATAAVMVATGKVAVSMVNNNKPLATLMANESLVFDKQTRQAYLSTSTVSEQERIQGYLIFEKMTFAAIALELENYYGVTIDFTNPALEHCIFKASFKPMPLEQVLDVLQQAIPFQYVYDQQTKKVLIRGKGCESKTY